MNQNIRFTSLLLLIVTVIAAVSISSGQKKNYFTYNESLDKTVAVVDGEELTLSDLAFYIVYEENLIEQNAFIYDPQNTARYWNIHTNGTYTRLEGKEAAINMAIHDEIFYRLSLEEGMELSEEEEAYLANTQLDFWSDLPEGALEKLGVSKDVLDESMRKIALAEKCQYLFAEMQEADFEEYSFAGAGYEKLMEEHESEIIEDVWERVHFGSITVAH